MNSKSIIQTIVVLLILILLSMCKSKSTQQITLTVNPGECITYNIKVSETEENEAYRKDSISIQKVGQILEEIQSGYSGQYELINTLKN